MSTRRATAAKLLRWLAKEILKGNATGSIEFEPHFAFRNVRSDAGGLIRIVEERGATWKILVESKRKPGATR